nr:retrovirus-related Pol polyprotein from transposon TNT 1-94 [Tanacetum cinerariifolium]
MEQAVILKEIVEQAKSLNSLDSASYSACKYIKLIQELLGYVRHTCPNIHKPSEKLVTVMPINKKKTVRRPTGRTFTLVGNACPLTRITTTNKLPLREPIPLEVVAQESVVTKVYTRIPKPNGSNSKPKIEKSMISNKTEPSTSRGSNTLVAPSSSSLVDLSINGKKYILVIMDDYSRFTWVKFLASKDEAPDFIIKFLRMIQIRLNALVRNIRTNNGTEFVNQTLRSYYESVGISHETSVTRSPQQNGVVERQKCTLVEAARTMLIYAKAPLFQWAEAVATACYTQNRSIIRHHHGKTPYELLHGRKPDLSYLHVFGALCYPNNDSEDLGKLQAKADISIFIGYAPKKKAYLLVVVAPRAIDLADSSVSTSIDHDAPSTSIPSTQNLEHSKIISQGFEKSPKTPHFNDEPLHESLHEDSTSQGTPSNVRPIHTLFESLGRCTKDHPIVNEIEVPCRSVSTRKQLQTDSMWCYFDAFLTLVEPKNFKQAMTKPSWINVKMDEFSRVLKNKARLVAQGFRQEEGICADNCPLMLEKDMYDSWKSRMELYMLNRPYSRMILESVEQGPLIWPSVEVEGVTRLKKYSELSAAEAIQADSPQIAYAQIDQQSSEYSPPEAGLVVPVFQKGDDPIDAINHMMSFLTSVVASRYPATNNQLRISLNPRQQATINNGRVTIQPIQGRQNYVLAGSARPFTSGQGGAQGKQRVITCYNCKGEGHMSKQCT